LHFQIATKKNELLVYTCCLPDDLLIYKNASNPPTHSRSRKPTPAKHNSIVNQKGPPVKKRKKTPSTNSHQRRPKDSSHKPTFVTQNPPPPNQPSLPTRKQMCKYTTTYFTTCHHKHPHPILCPHRSPPQNPLYRLELHHQKKEYVSVTRSGITYTPALVG